MKNKPWLSIGVVSLFLLASSFSDAQEKSRAVLKSQQYPNSPIEMVGWELGDKSFKYESRVFAGPDWLKRMKLLIKNVSNRNIKSFDIDLLVKQQGRVLMGIPIYFRTYKTVTDYNALNTKGEKKIGSLQPGEILKIRVLDHVMKTFGDELRKRGLEDLDSVTLDLRSVFFDDGTRWMFGRESRPDPANPGKRIRPSLPSSKITPTTITAAPTRSTKASGIF